MILKKQLNDLIEYLKKHNFNWKTLLGLSIALILLFNLLMEEKGIYIAINIFISIPYVVFLITFYFDLLYKIRANHFMRIVETRIFFFILILIVKIFIYPHNLVDDSIENHFLKISLASIPLFLSTVAWMKYFEVKFDAKAPKKNQKKLI